MRVRFRDFENGLVKHVVGESEHLAKSVFECFSPWFAARALEAITPADLLQQVRGARLRTQCGE